MKKLLSVLTVVAVLCCMTVSAFATSDLTINGTYNTNVYEKVGNNYEFKTTLEDYASNGKYLYFVNLSGQPYMYVLDKKLAVRDDGYLYYTGDVEYYYFLWTTVGYETKGWEFKESYSSSNSAGDQYGKAELLQWASVNVMNDDGTVYMNGDPNFREPPLATLVLKVTEEELVEVAVPEMVGAMKVLVPCGVGLMALLVGLSLFGKRSLIFLR